MKRASCGLNYGAMNTLKTTQLGRIAEYLWKKYGLYSRLITADNEHDTLEEHIAKGYMKPFTITSIPNPFAVTRKLAMGFWPAIQDGRLVMNPTPPEEWRKIGAYLNEGTTTISELLHQDHISKGRKIGEELVGKFDDAVALVNGETEVITFAKSAQSHFGQVQDYVALDLIPKFSMLPVKWVWWTGHEYQGEDEATGQMRLGPGLVGKAATMKVPRKLGNTFHSVIYTDPRTSKNEYRAYFAPHPDVYMRNQHWPAGLKMPSSWVTEWWRRFPDGYITLTLDKGIEQFLEFQDEMVAKYGELQEEAGALEVLPPSPSRSVTPSSRPYAPVQPITTAQPATGMATNASQLRPPTRPAYPPRPSRFPARPPMQAPIPQPTTEELLEKSIEQVTGRPVELPDINAVPAAPEKEPA